MAAISVSWTRSSAAAGPTRPRASPRSQPAWARSSSAEQVEESAAIHREYAAGSPSVGPIDSARGFAGLARRPRRHAPRLSRP